MTGPGNTGDAPPPVETKRPIRQYSPYALSMAVSNAFGEHGEADAEADAIEVAAEEREMRDGDGWDEPRSWRDQW